MTRLKPALLARLSFGPVPEPSTGLLVLAACSAS